MYIVVVVVVVVVVFLKGSTQFRRLVWFRRLKIERIKENISWIWMKEI